MSLCLSIQIRSVHDPRGGKRKKGYGAQDHRHAHPWQSQHFSLHRENHRRAYPFKGRKDEKELHSPHGPPLSNENKRSTEKADQQKSEVSLPQKVSR